MESSSIPVQGSRGTLLARALRWLPAPDGVVGKATVLARTIVHALASGGLLLCLTGCGDRERSAGTPPGPSPSPGDGANAARVPAGAFTPPAAHAQRGDPYTTTIAEERRLKDEYFRSSPDTPVPEAERGRFPPLQYYPVDPAWRMTLPVETYAEPRTFELVTNLGELRRFRHEAQVHFTRAGQVVSLQLYREIEPNGPSASYWVSFTDAAAGRETYPGGRYLDVVPHQDGTVTLDFNRAYNPYCAYGWPYSCPMAPPENRLKVAIPAGERGFHLAHVR